MDKQVDMIPFKVEFGPMLDWSVLNFKAVILWILVLLLFALIVTTIVYQSLMYKATKGNRGVVHRDIVKKYARIKMVLFWVMLLVGFFGIGKMTYVVSNNFGVKVDSGLEWLLEKGSKDDKLKLDGKND